MKNGIPEKDDIFDAYILRYGNLHRCSPFTCTHVDLAWVYGIDENGTEFEFRKSKFVFRKVKECTNGNTKSKIIE